MNDYIARKNMHTPQILRAMRKHPWIIVMYSRSLHRKKVVLRVIIRKYELAMECRCMLCLVGFKVCRIIKTGSLKITPKRRISCSSCSLSVMHAL